MQLRWFLAPGPTAAFSAAVLSTLVNGRITVTALLARFGLGPKDLRTDLILNMIFCPLAPHCQLSRQLRHNLAQRKPVFLEDEAS